MLSLIHIQMCIRDRCTIRVNLVSPDVWESHLLIKRGINLCVFLSCYILCVRSKYFFTVIRTQQARPKSSAAPRSDPVALYQYYQQVWKQQKLPGEDPHTDLRWTIREKMLGQTPNPCPRVSILIQLNFDQLLNALHFNLSLLLIIY